MRAVFSVTLTLFVLSLPTIAGAQSPIAVPRSNLERCYAPEISARAQTASGAAKAAGKLAGWINGLGLSNAIDRSLREHDQPIRALLDSSGQPGVLVYVQIERLHTETPRYELAGDKVLVVGAGTGVDDVYFGYIQKNNFTAKRDDAATDLDSSYFLWYTKSGKAIQVTTTPAKFVVYQAAQRLADDKLRDMLNATANGRAFGLAVDHMEQTTRSRELKKLIAELKAKQAETNQRAAKIESDLQRELERARKAAIVANQLGMIATVFTVASQVASAASYFGSDAPPSVVNAKTPEELRGAVNNMLSEAIRNRDALQVQYKSTIEQRSGLKTQYFGLLMTGKYPLNDVPQIRP